MEFNFHQLCLLSMIFSLHSVVLMANISCPRFQNHNNVHFSVSDCFVYEMHITPKYMEICLQKCHVTPGCIAIGSDSMEMTNTCCILVNSDIDLLEGSSTIIHQTDVRVCIGSNWNGTYTSPYNNPLKKAFSFKLRFRGLSKNCSHFTGMIIQVSIQ